MSPHLNYQVACARQNAIAAHTLHAHHAAEWQAANRSRHSRVVSAWNRGLYSALRALHTSESRSPRITTTSTRG
jgi:hypothetical protein